MLRLSSILVGYCLREPLGAPLVKVNIYGEVGLAIVCVVGAKLHAYSLVFSLDSDSPRLYALPPGLKHCLHHGRGAVVNVKATWVGKVRGLFCIFVPFRHKVDFRVYAVFRLIVQNGHNDLIGLNQLRSPKVLKPVTDPKPFFGRKGHNLVSVQIVQISQIRRSEHVDPKRLKCVFELQNLIYVPGHKHVEQCFRVFWLAYSHQAHGRQIRLSED